jgi:hypothetical protein
MHNPEENILTKYIEGGCFILDNNMTGNCINHYVDGSRKRLFLKMSEVVELSNRLVSSGKRS